MKLFASEEDRGFVVGGRGFVAVGGGFGEGGALGKWVALDEAGKDGPLAK
jgi:hypothetical protein